MISIRAIFRLLGRILYEGVATFFRKYWFKVILIALLLQVFYEKEISIDLTLSSLAAFERENQTKLKQIGMYDEQSVYPNTLGIGAISYGSKISKYERANQIEETDKLEKTSYQSVCSFIFSGSPSGKYQFDTALVAKEFQLCQHYLNRFKPVAVYEQQKFGIPASIKLAQALLESDAGQNLLAKDHHNHFGIRCATSSKTGCVRVELKGQIAAYRQYENAWTSFRMHSLLLQQERYESLFEIPVYDYVSWAEGLEQTGYSSDPDYAEKLIRIIEFFQLND